MSGRRLRWHIDRLSAMPIDQARAIHDQRLSDVQTQLHGMLAGQTRVTLEVGCGHGHFLTDYASQHRSEFCIGIDLLKDRLERAGRKSARLGLSNIGWVHAEARLFLEALPANLRLGPVIFILFPDPWPKRRHWKHRVLQAEFLAALAARAETGTRLCFRTDYAPYFADAREMVASHPDWTLETPVQWPFERETVFQSRADAFQSLTALRR